MDIKEFSALHEQFIRFTGLDGGKLALLKEAGEVLGDELDDVVAEFYAALDTEEEMRAHLPSELEGLKSTQRQWLGRVFFGNYDLDHSHTMRQIGFVHYSIELPVEFMGLGMNRMRDSLQRRLVGHYAGDPAKLTEVLSALNAALDHNLMMMEYTYIESMVAGELEDFLEITGMTRELFNNLAHMNR